MFSDVSGKCLKGATEYVGELLHVGNGVARINRQNLFGPNPTVRYAYNNNTDSMSLLIEQYMHINVLMCFIYLIR